MWPQDCCGRYGKGVLFLWGLRIDCPNLKYSFWICLVTFDSFRISHWLNSTVGGIYWKCVLHFSRRPRNAFFSWNFPWWSVHDWWSMSWFWSIILHGNFFGQWVGRFFFGAKTTPNKVGIVIIRQEAHPRFYLSEYFRDPGDGLHLRGNGDARSQHCCSETWSLLMNFSTFQGFFHGNHQTISGESTHKKPIFLGIFLFMIPIIYTIMT